MKTVIDATEFAIWLRQAPVDEPLGFAIWVNTPGVTKIAITNRSFGWVLDESEMEPVAWTTCISALRFQLQGTTPVPPLITRYFIPDFSSLASLIGVSERLSHIIYDAVDVLSGCIGRTFMDRSYWQERDDIRMDAMDALITCEQYKIEAPPYYARVALPNARTIALRGFNKPALEDHQWVITYDHLLLRVIAHLTQDPVLRKLFLDPELRKVDPLSFLGQTLDLDPIQVLPLFMYLALDEDEAALRQFYPEVAQYLPDNAPMIRVEKIDHKLPTMRFGMVQLLDRHNRTSLYGRLAPASASPQWLADFQYMGSVNDILAVACATFYNAGSRQHAVADQTWGKAVIRGWYTDESYVNDLDELAQLLIPLSVPLDPKVVLL